MMIIAVTVQFCIKLFLSLTYKLKICTIFNFLLTIPYMMHSKLLILHNPYSKHHKIM